MVNAIVEWKPVKLSGYVPACPAPIVAMRAALARTPPVRALRPKPLALKFAAVGATSLSVNLPLGAWREHCRKFSPEWFVAVHASIPLIVTLRKAVVMPTYAGAALRVFALPATRRGPCSGRRLFARRR